MTLDECLDEQFKLRYKAEYSARYHRRRAAFLSNLDTSLTLITIMAGASTFGDLVVGSPGWLAKLGAALVTLISLLQVILRLAPQAAAHAQWLKRCTSLLADQTLTTVPTQADIQRWTHESTAIETECVGELRALVYDCEDAAARAMNIPDRQHKNPSASAPFHSSGYVSAGIPAGPRRSTSVAAETVSYSSTH